MIEWHKEMKLAYRWAQHSSDASTQLGAVLVDRCGQFLSVGYNAIPSEIKYSRERRERPLKYKYTEHAERRAIFYCSRWGRTLDGATMICPWAACCDCSRAIICSGIKRLVVHGPMMEKAPERWHEEVERGHEMMEEAGIEIVSLEGKIGNLRPILFDGQPWHP